MSGLFVKWYLDALSDPVIARAARNGAKKLEMLPWLMAWAKRANDDGRLTINGDPATPLDIAETMSIRPKAGEVERALAELMAVGLVVRDDDGAFRLSEWSRQSAKPSDSREQTAERKRRQRERERHEQSSPVTPCHAPHVTRGHATEQEQETEREPEKDQEQRRAAFLTKWCERGAANDSALRALESDELRTVVGEKLIAGCTDDQARNGIEEFNAKANHRTPPTLAAFIENARRNRKQPADIPGDRRSRIATGGAADAWKLD